MQHAFCQPGLKLLRSSDRLAVPLRSRKLASEKGIEPCGFRWIAVPQIGLKRFITTWNTTHMHQLDVTAFRDQRTELLLIIRAVACVAASYWVRHAWPHGSARLSI
jgi:hypothetical protein